MPLPSTTLRRISNRITCLDFRYRDAAILFAIALMLKLSFFYIVKDNPFIADLTNDETHHFQTAESIIENGPIRDDAFYFAPLYPYLLAGFFSLFGKNVMWVKVIQIVAGSANAVIFYFLVLQIFQKRAVALLAAAMALLYGGYYFFEILLLKTTLAVLFTNTGLLLIALGYRTKRNALWLVAGLVFGLTCLLRGNTLLVIPFILLGLIYEWRIRNVNYLPPILFTLGTLLAISPATLHNACVTGDFVLTTYQGGSNFYIGNFDGADGTYKPLRPRRQTPAMEKEDAVSIAESNAGRKLKPSEVSSFWAGRSIDYMLDKPLDWLILTVKKIGLFHSDTELGDTIYYSEFRDKEPILYLAVLPFGLIVSLAAVGVTLTLPQWRQYITWYLMLFAFAASVFIFFIFARYRTPVAGLYIIFAAYAAWQLIYWLQKKKFAEPIIALACVLAIFISLTKANIANVNPAAAYNNLGAKYITQGDNQNAMEQFRKALDMAPYNLNYRHNYAKSLSRLGRNKQAAQQWRMVIERLCKELPARSNDVVIYEEILEAYEQYTEVLERLDRSDEIAALKNEKQPHMDTLIELYRRQPPSPSRDFKTGSLLVDAGQHEQAIEYLQSAAQNDPANPRIHIKLGLAWVGLNNINQAEAAFTKALELDPNNPVTHQLRGNVHYLLARPRQALDEWHQSLQLDPDNEQLQKQYNQLKTQINNE